MKIPRKTTKWHAVSVVVQTSSCAAATLCRNVRYLATDAPRLPLPACDRAHECKCTFRHYEDRRASAKRRSDDVGAGGTTKPKVERRLKRGRRATDR